MLINCEEIGITPEQKQIIEDSNGCSLETLINRELSRLVKKERLCKAKDSVESLSLFIELKYEYDRNKHLVLNDFYIDYSLWCTKLGKQLHSKALIIKNLENSGHIFIKKGGANIVKIYGLKLKTDEDELW